MVNLLGNRITLFILLFFIFINFPRLWMDFYTLEWNFIELANFFNQKNDYFSIERYKIWQANNIVYPKILSLLNFDLSDRIFIFICRTLNLFLVIFCIFRFLKSKFIDERVKQLIIFSLIFLPILNVYIFRIYPDLISVSFFYLTILSLIEKKLFQFSIFFLISIFIKPIAIIFSPVLLFLSFDWNYKNLNKLYFSKDIIKTSSIIFFLVFLYFFYLIFYEKIIFSNQVGSSYLNFDVFNSINNFFRYFIYILIILFPFVINTFITIYRDVLIMKLYKVLFSSLALAGALSLAINLNSGYGELNFGYIDNYFQNYSFLISFFLVFNIFLLFFYSLFQLGFQKSKFLYLFIFSLLILSIFIYRPAQRYFLYFLPFFYYFIFNNFKISHFIKEKFFLYFCLFAYSLVSLGQLYVQYEKTIVNGEVVNFLSQENMIDTTYPGDIRGSHGHLFLNYLKNVKNTELKEDTIYSVTVNSCKKDDLFFVSKTILFSNYQICVKKN